MNGHSDTPKGASGGALPMPGQGVPTAPQPPASAQMTFAGIFGEIVLLLGQSPLHRHMYIADLEWRLLPAMIESQFRTFRDDHRVIGLALWASVSEEVEKLLENGVGNLRPGDWKSGERLWLVELVAPFGGIDAMLEDLRTTVFRGKTVKMHVTDESGRRVVRKLEGGTP